ncbi:MAG: hypothetical protein GAK36_00053 [Pseudomonas sp.]|nr:MAG: hypothetical protein GAK36_00053 [Pseudomonas sp.]
MSNSEMISVPRELLPCSFCGQQDAFVEQLDSDSSVVICQGRVDEHSACLARGPVGIQESEDELQPGYDAAVREWNRRAKPAAQPQGEPVAFPGYPPVPEDRKLPAPAALVLPDRKPEPSCMTAVDDDREAVIWNACLDAVARLNKK